MTGVKCLNATETGGGRMKKRSFFIRICAGCPFHPKFAHAGTLRVWGVP